MNIQKIIGLVLLLVSISLILTAIILSKKYQRDRISIYEREILLEATDEILLNPGMGWILLDTATPRWSDKGRSGEYELVNNVGIMTTWGFLEPEKEVYDFNLVDETIDYWVSKGKDIHFRISTDDFPYYLTRLPGAPDWLYDLGVTYQDLIYPLENIPLKFPDLNNEIYKENLNRFMQKFGEKYRNNPNIKVVGLRGYGHWGEWHSGFKFDNWEDRRKGLSGVIDIWVSAFKGKKHLSLNYSHEWLSDTLDGRTPVGLDEFMEYSALDYAMKFEEIGFEREGVYWAMIPVEWEFNRMTFNEGKMQIAEIAGSYTQLKQKQNEDGIDHAKEALKDCLRLRPNYITIFGWDQQGSAREFYDERSDLIEFGLLHMGYRIYPEKNQYPSHVYRGETFTIKQSWVNKAFGRMFEEADISIKIEDSRGREIASAKYDEMKWRELVKDNIVESNINVTIPKRARRGTHRILVSVIEREENNFIKLPLENEEHGYYTIGEITIK